MRAHLRAFHAYISILASVATAGAITVSQPSLGSAASEQSCLITRPGTRFAPSTGQVFFRFLAQSVREGQKLDVEWIGPSGQVASTVPFDTLPAAPSLCLMTQLPVGGFAPGGQPGRWTVRVVSAGAVLHASVFEILPDANAGGFVIRAVTHRGADAGSHLSIDGLGFSTSVIVNIAQYNASGGWTYIHFLFPATASSTNITATVPKLATGEYIVILKDPAGRLSAPARFVIAAVGGYRLPFRPQDNWVVTQGPYGGFSHWGRSLHAYDLAPQSGSCVVAMRAGVVTAQDLGYGQTPHLRIFGNYVTIAHEDGEYSHYAHLRTGTFVVKTGQRVEAGQALARVGNSGHSFGVHVHVHVTKAAWISTPSVPFRFEDAPYRPGFRGPVTSRNVSAHGDCGRNGAPPVFLSSGGTPTVAGRSAIAPTWTGQVAVADWWHKTLVVPRGSATLSVQLGWAAREKEGERDFDLYLISPSGRQYNPHADRTGYATPSETEEAFTIAHPEAGIWQISVQGVRGNGEMMDFWVSRGISGGAKGQGGGDI